MSENKQFVNVGKDILLDGEVWCTAGGEHCADVITAALNITLKENEKLKAINQDHEDYLGDLEADFVRLEKENTAFKEKISNMLNFLEEKGSINRQELKDWWNGG